jgi:molybdopterin converting factor small subunit
VARLRLFGPAREAAGRGTDQIAGRDVGEVLAEAERRFGSTFAAVLASSKVWVNGQESSPSTTVGEDDEVAVIPPVSGGS